MGRLWKYCLFVTRDCLEDCFGLISLKPMSHCFHYKDFNIPVSFGKGLHLFWNKSKDPQMYCLLSGPAHESCASGSHCRGVRRIFILWVVSQVSQGVCMGPASLEAAKCKNLECVGTFRQHSCPAVQDRDSPSPGAAGILHKWCCAALGICRAVVGWGDLSVSEWSQIDLYFRWGSSGLRVEGRTLGPVLYMKEE